MIGDIEEKKSTFDASTFKPNVGDVFTCDDSYPHYAEYANNNNLIINEIESLADGTRQFRLDEPVKPTADELELSKAEAELNTLDSNLKDLETRYVQAQLLDDTESLTSIKTEYKNLLGVDNDNN